MCVSACVCVCGGPRTGRIKWCVCVCGAGPTVTRPTNEPTAITSLLARAGSAPFVISWGRELSLESCRQENLSARCTVPKLSGCTAQRRKHIMPVPIALYLDLSFSRPRCSSP